MWKKMDQGAVTLVVELEKAFEHMQLKVVWAWAMHFGYWYVQRRVSGRKQFGLVNGKTI